MYRVLLLLLLLLSLIPLLSFLLGGFCSRQLSSIGFIILLLILQSIPLLFLSRG